ncbi:MAG TPA: hypothetical protein VFX12_01150 [Vicinamibacterales bacterium]|nr:hypothetical protein [Vicinamibacterales bacterium]
MSARRTAAYIGAGVLLMAWLTTAAGRPDQAAIVPAAIAPTTGSVDLRALADGVQAQAALLRERLARAPAPHAHARNPFMFAPRRPVQTPPSLRTRPPAGAEAAPGTPIGSLQLPLDLIGVAEDVSPEGLHRTAMIAGPDDTLYMLVEGQAFAGRYRVAAIGTDAVELHDLTTGAIRRLALR